MATTRRLRPLTLFTLVLGLLTSLPIRAWGPGGHATVGLLAEQLLAGTATGRAVQARLGGVSLAEAGVWADCLKAVRPQGEGFVYAEPGRFAECQPFETAREQAAAVAFAQTHWRGCGAGEQACHRRWHYTDVAVQRPAYASGLAGTRADDVVGALGAAIAHLQGRPTPAGFHFQNETEALRLLVHLVADLHQPLHVGAVYLDAQGQLIDPDHQPHDQRHDTVGGNRLDDGGQNLHRRWDELPPALGPRQLGVQGLAEARRVPASSGPVADWPRAWATDSLHAARQALGGLRYGPASGTPRQWPVLGGEAAAPAREALQRAQLLKAGARLAELLRALWP